MKSVFVLATPDKSKFVQCWTEGSTIFLSSNFDNAERHSSEKEARHYKIMIDEHAKRFLLNENEKEVDKPELRVYEAKIYIELIDKTTN